MEKKKTAPTVGILALQGSVIEHESMLRKIGVNTLRVLKPEHLEQIDGIILPGGESTTLGKLLKLFSIAEPLKAKIENGLPVFGTCAGLILLAKEIEGEEPHLGVMDIRVRRNAYGRQIDSFIAHEVIEEFSPLPLELVFVRAPAIEKTFGKAKVLKELNGRIIAARQENMLVTSFHPELTDDETVHRYFLNMFE
ncbi:pyridoxal 5'-phosphate synthase glutaminase subunit PdxT [Pumilibacter muris]|uniref:pyridoxal 5'-phosphate synthase glutaminase subunit PdxT n=1 Tax=Pumilibacter muris TaxID=2941510 RepID=UPI00203EE6CB|nr:pyridoxal 5'-phosphate synthase glutaminase subunit PdxT [Pumilibacter muris]